MIETLYFFEPLDALLIETLTNLDPHEWERPTVAKLWTVKDVAAHLLDGNLRALSIARDGYASDAPGDVGSYDDLVSYLNRLNADWVQACKRLSPLVLIQLLKDSGHEYINYLKSLNLYEKAVFSVAWAGEGESKNWMHMAREYTEKWLHQQQIRKATNRPGILTGQFFRPLISTFMLGLPYALRNADAREGTILRVTIGSDVGGSWAVVRQEGSWRFTNDTIHKLDAEVTVEPDIAWQLFSKSLRPADVHEGISVQGNAELAQQALNMISVMA